MMFAAYRLWFQIGAIVVLLAAFTWGVHTYNEHFREIGRAQVKAEWDAAEKAAEKAAREKEAIWRKQLEDAQNAAIERDKTNQAALAAANNAVGGLRRTLTGISGGVPGASTSSLANSVIALATVFGDCSNRYIGMAEIAGRHAADAQRLQDSWPKVK